MDLWAQVPGSAEGGSGGDGSGTGSVVEETTTTSDDSGTDGLGTSETKFDLGAPGLSPDYDDPSIPPTCEVAAAEPSSMGCTFFAVDLDQALTAEFEQFAVAVGNVQPDTPATVSVELKEDGIWSVVAGPLAIDPLDAQVITLPDNHREGSGVLVGGAYRIISDVPVSAYQFSPLDGLAGQSSEVSLR